MFFSLVIKLKAVFKTAFSLIKKSGLVRPQKKSEADEGAIRQLCSKALQVPYFGGGFVIPITVPYRLIVCCMV